VKVKSGRSANMKLMSCILTNHFFLRDEMVMVIRCFGSRGYGKSDGLLCVS